MLISDMEFSCENKTDGDDSLRTMNCLKGRLLAERLASTNATKEAEHLGKKLLQLENQLKEEANSRNRAQKKLKLLMKMLESSDIVKEFKENVESSKWSANLKENGLQFSLWSLLHEGCTTDGKSSTSSTKNPISSMDSSSSACELHSEKLSQMNTNQIHIDSTKNEQRMGSSCEEDHIHEDQDLTKRMNNSMALNSVEMPKKDERIDPEVVDASVKEVLESLRRAKEQLQSSIERRLMSLSTINIR